MLTIKGTTFWIRHGLECLITPPVLAKVFGKPGHLNRVDEGPVEIGIVPAAAADNDSDDPGAAAVSDKCISGSSSSMCRAETVGWGLREVELIVVTVRVLCQLVHENCNDQTDDDNNDSDYLLTHSIMQL